MTDKKENETKNSVPGISAVPHPENLRYFDVTIDGPDSSPYEGTLCPSSPPLPYAALTLHPPSPPAGIRELTSLARR